MRKILAIAILLSGMPLAAEPVPEYVLKATYLYNFALYTEWPAGVGDTLNLCVFGEDSFGKALDTINGKQVNDMRLNVNHISMLDEIKGCQMVFLGERERYHLPSLLGTLGGSPVLTVTEGPVPLYSGVMVNMVVEDQRLVFHINASAARRSKLNFSSKLLRLAKTVY